MTNLLWYSLVFLGGMFLGVLLHAIHSPWKQPINEISPHSEPSPPPERPKRIISREFTEITRGYTYQIPQFGIIRKLWVELPADTKMVKVTINADYFLYAQPRFLKEHTDGNILHLESVLPIFKNYDSQQYVRAVIEVETDNPQPHFTVHRRVDQLYAGW